MESERISNYLKAESEQGSRDETDLEFTVNLESAWSKLGRFQLASGTEWVLKVIQAAVAGGSSRVEVGRSSNKVSIDLACLPAWHMEKLRPLLLGKRNDAEAGMQDLIVAIRSFSEEGGRAISVTFRDGQRLVWDGSQIVFDQIDRDSSEVNVEVDLLPVRDQGSFFSLGSGKQADRYWTDIHHELVTRCAYAPVPIVIEGSKMENFSQQIRPFLYVPIFRTLPEIPQIEIPKVPRSFPLKFHWKVRYKEWTTEVEQLASGYSVSPNRVPELSQDRTEHPWGGVFFVVNQAPQVSQGHTILRPEALESAVQWVKNGVVVASSNPKQFPPRPVGLRVVLDAMELPTDLSGLALVETDKKQKLERMTLQHTHFTLAFLVEQGVGDLLDIRDLECPNPASYTARIKASLSTMAELSIALMPLFLLPCAGVEAYRSYNVKNTFKSDRELLQQACRDLVTDLETYLSLEDPSFESSAGA